MAEQGNVNRLRAKMTSAGRMAAMLTDLRRANANSLYQAVPITVLGCSANTVTAAIALEGFGLCQEMIDAFGREINSSHMQDDERNYCLRPLPNLTEKLFPASLNQVWGSYRDQFDNTLLEQLNGADMVLRRFVDELQLDKSDLDVFRESINDALQAASHLNVPTELRNFLLQQLMKVDGAVQQYRFRGYAGIRDAIAGYMTALTVATTAVDKSSGETDAPNATKVTNPILKRLGNVVLAFQLIHSIAHEVKISKPYVLEAWHETQKLLEK